MDDSNAISVTAVAMFGRLRTKALNYYTPMLTQDVIEIHHKHSPGKVFENA